MISIRPAVAEDAQLIFDFIVELAVYEKAPEAVTTDVARIRQSLFGEGASAKALICTIDDEAVGYAVYFYSYSTWLGKNGIYLEDVYVAPAHRGKGAGKAMLRHLARIAVAEDCGRLEWSVLDWNTPAIEFYQALQAAPQSEWIKYRLDGAALQQLAATPD